MTRTGKAVAVTLLVATVFLTGWLVSAIRGPRGADQVYKHPAAEVRRR